MDKRIDVKLFESYQEAEQAMKTFLDGCSEGEKQLGVHSITLSYAFKNKGAMITSLSDQILIPDGIIDRQILINQLEGVVKQLKNFEIPQEVMKNI